MIRIWCFCSLASVLLSLTVSPAGGQDRKWSLSKAVEILNSSPWARQETFTRVVAGVGSGISGEKEIFNAFNHANFKMPERTWGTSVFGKVFGAERAREVEIALKYSF